MINPLLRPLLNLLDHITSGEHYEKTNPYCRLPVKEALQAVAMLTGTPGWMDAAGAGRAMLAKEQPKSLENLVKNFDESRRTLENLELLRAAVAAKLAYWDANGALEDALAQDLSDADSDALEEHIKILAASCNETSDVAWISLASLVPLGFGAPG